MRKLTAPRVEIKQRLHLKQYTKRRAQFPLLLLLPSTETTRIDSNHTRERVERAHHANERKLRENLKKKIEPATEREKKGKRGRRLKRVRSRAFLPLPLFDIHDGGERKRAGVCSLLCFPSSPPPPFFYLFRVYLC